MATILCPPAPYANKPWRPWVVFCGMAAALAVVIGITAYSTPTYPPQEKTTRTAAQTTEILTFAQRDALEQMIARNWVRLDEKRKRAYVAPLVWQTFDASRKEDLAAVCGGRIAELRGWSERASITVIDMQSGRELGAHVWGGFKFY